MDRIEPNELATLIFGLLTLILLAYALRREHLPQFRLFFIGFLFLLSANFFTVAEGFFWSGTLNVLEHLCYFLAGMVFLIAAWSTRRSGGFVEEEHGTRRLS